jgi:predicted RNA binding protein YcfA (HicA-like mRNA interferase family)
MKPLSADEVEAYLRQYGFVRGHGGKGSHVGWFHPETGRTTIVPHHGSRKLAQGTLNAIFSQAGIPKPQR